MKSLGHMTCDDHGSCVQGFLQRLCRVFSFPFTLASMYVKDSIEELILVETLTEGGHENGRRHHQPDSQASQRNLEQFCDRKVESQTSQCCHEGRIPPGTPGTTQILGCGSDQGCQLSK